MAKADFAFTHPIRVRWSEVDMQRVVFNGHYLNYFDVAVFEYWRAMAASESEAFKNDLAGWMHNIYVVKATLEYHASAKFDEVIDIGVRCAKLGRSSMRYTPEIYCGERHLISGELVYVYRDPVTEQSGPMPEALRARIIAYERVQPEVSGAQATAAPPF
jgi:acyl-CoA thioester hydrolase